MEIPFDGILTLLIFLVGIPALVLQLISATERRAVLKEGRLDVRSFLMKALWVLGIGLLLQFGFAAFWHFPSDQVTGKLIEQIIWLGIFGTLFYFAWQVAQQVPEQYGRREKIVDKLTQEALKDAQRKARVGGRTFEDLANLGKHCDPGQEREMVVAAFLEIVKAVLVDPRYAGESFETLIDELVQMLASNPEAKDLSNYKMAVEIFSSILAADHSVETDDDKQRAVHALSQLGRTLIVNFRSVERDNVILNCIDSLEFALTSPHMVTEVSQALFEIGVCAAQADHDFVALAALDKLTSLAERQPSLPVEFCADMFGLLARYWGKDGSRGEYASSKFEEMIQFLGRNKIQTLKSAQTHLVKTMYFDEADNVGKMIKDLEPKPNPLMKN